MSWWDREHHADRRPVLLARNRIQRAIRDWFEGRGFVEVDPLCMVTSPGNETHLHAFETEEIAPNLSTRRRYLHTSPEFAMKKLLAAGEERIFTFSHVWRNREGGPRHGSEFVMLEWYRANAPYTVLMEDCAELLRVAAEAAGSSLLRHGEATCDPLIAPRRVSVADAFGEAGIDLLSTLPDGVPDTGRLAAALDRVGVKHMDGETWSDLFSRVLVGEVEPGLGHAATFLDRYPAPEAALARRCPDDPRVAERFELFACGVELANGFGELTDPEEQRARFTADMDERERIYGSRYPLDEEFLAALAHMPPSSGIALGFDRLVMLATGAPRISDVIWA
ncbi:EF-P lysine aminoacylase EpmA [Pelagovum pacificum]|uniref:EF-P lysine aminoacylase GenX n=1 Tax=Pelagovum pacificum TaxID=2588711 RepID=A0A5C5GKE8_9RHOB|nr:EF-P lysine aminoacylase EpmA [Pelagovum pacificum]QQA42920.1 EF-P lysine aminoacylase GenX [Pelagovum pacificum]TNY33936.1 EF-P lysine aminoacylase GenX [Pelagovum pacificum]